MLTMIANEIMNLFVFIKTRMTGGLCVNLSVDPAYPVYDVRSLFFLLLAWGMTCQNRITVLEVRFPCIFDSQ